ncbi:10 kDa heat shock protein, mitochondrial [Tupaia chinensis]|uniref:10 kDa heat shock protein, mitochondrial n=1 Tax=Tupaia chinensis TaxID=246437 RepID=L9KMS5_TUPCH|nr:10 kDa heat shock protein, mitochondrial [Tupaia chinensis]
MRAEDFGIVTAGQALRKLLLCFHPVIGQKSAAKAITKGDSMLPEQSRGKVLQTTVAAVRSSSEGKGGEIQLVNVKVGYEVLPQTMGNLVELDDKDYSYLEMVAFLESRLTEVNHSRNGIT